MKNNAKPYAALRRWKDNEKDFEVVEYFEYYSDARKFIAHQPRDERYRWEIGRYS